MKTSDEIALGAAVISALSLVVTLVFAFLNRRYTRAQIALSKEQFDRTNKPNVNFDVLTRLKPAERKGVYVRVTNNHPSIPVGEIRAWLDAPAPTGNLSWLFRSLRT